jgi:hypothetical protein
LVEPQRLQALDQTGKNPLDSPIQQMVKKYFGALPHTPVTLGGFNFRGNLRFDDPADENKFDDLMGTDRGKIKNLTKSSNPRASLLLRWPYENGSILLQVNKPKGVSLECSIHFNFEFEYTGSVAFF